MSTNEPDQITWVTAMDAIKRTPVAESEAFFQIPFFRDDRRHITLIDGVKYRAEQFNNDHGAAELCRRALSQRKGQ